MDFAYSIRTREMIGRLVAFMDAHFLPGNQAFHDAVAAGLQTAVVDRSMQVFGAAGITPDTPLGFLWTRGRALRSIDGPDEVHLTVIARDELGKAKTAAGRNSHHFVRPGGETG